MKIKKSLGIIERLKCCWFILTMQNFFVSCYANDIMVEGEDGFLEHPRKGSVKGYYHIEDETFISYVNGNESKLTLRDLICDNMIHVINKIKERTL